MLKIAVLIVCHNRKEKTIKCLQKLYSQKNIENIKFKVFLVDDGSSDGTEHAISQSFPDVVIIKGNGNLFWAGGMRIAWNSAKKKQYDYYLWLNDDVFLYNNFLESCLKDIQTVKKQEQKKNLLFHIQHFAIFTNVNLLVVKI